MTPIIDVKSLGEPTIVYCTAQYNSTIFGPTCVHSRLEAWKIHVTTLQLSLSNNFIDPFPPSLSLCRALSLSLWLHFTFLSLESLSLPHLNPGVWSPNRSSALLAPSSSLLVINGVCLLREAREKPEFQLAQSTNTSRPLIARFHYLSLSGALPSHFIISTLETKERIKNNQNPLQFLFDSIDPRI